MEALQADDPTLVGRFRVVGRLGVGGMGRVYAATVTLPPEYTAPRRPRRTARSDL